MYCVLKIFVFGLIVVSIKAATAPKVECPMIKCAAPRPDACTEEGFIIIKGVKCPGCPKEIPCSIACQLPKKQGNCKAAMPRFYFDTRLQSCKHFIYGGCDGNANRFMTMAECERKCKKYGK